MDVNQLWVEIKNTCLLKDSKCKYHFQGVRQASYNQESHTLTLFAEDIVKAMVLRSCYGQMLISELEKLVGSPAFIDCQYKHVTHSHQNFNVSSLEDEDIERLKTGHKSVLEELLGEVSLLKKRVEALERNKSDF